jgi:hypothetical protein
VAGCSAWGNDTTEFLVYSGIQAVEEVVAIICGYRVPEMGDREKIFYL